jgi:hypothetical protein
MIHVLSDSEGRLLFLYWARIFTDKTRWPFLGDLVFAFSSSSSPNVTDPP